MPIEVVLFDLGGVLIDFGGVGPLRELSGIGSDDEVWARWLACEWVRAFERGACDRDAFAQGVATDWDLPIDGPAFLAEFSGWLGDALPGAADLVREVQQVVPVGCLSNTNPEHWGRRARWPFLDALDHRFLSFELGHVKPDQVLFDRVAELLCVPADRVLFLDDNQINVDGAVAAGFRSMRARGPAEARAVLVRAGVLPTS
jgi:FMN phosphatase YigB (HAD superfamily)